MTTSCQRWRRRRASYRPAGEPIKPSRYCVELLDEGSAKAFVVEHHYSGSYPAARLRVGLFGPGRLGYELCGVAVFSVPMQSRVIPKWLGVEPADGVELGRFVLLDEVPANGESWFLSRAFRIAREELGIAGVVSYSDPVPRVSESGELVSPGHVGTIYQATNATYHGRSRAETVVVDLDGRTVSRRLLSKIRRGESGERYAYERLRRCGAPRRRYLESGADYVARALAEGPFRRFRHQGNHVYTWRFDGTNSTQPSYPYPKRGAA